MAARRKLFQQGDVDVLVVRPWYKDDEEWDEEEVEKDGEKNEEVGEERQASGVQLILQVSLFNPNALKQASAHRSLLQEVGVLWTNLTQSFRSPKPGSTCDPSDLYPLAKDAVELANGILEHQEFGDRLVENMPSYHTARVVSSWTIGTQIYDDYVNYLGPIAMNPYLFLFRILFEASLVFFLVSMISFLCQTLVNYRHRILCCRRWCFRRKPPRYQSVPTDDDDSLTDKIMGSTNSGVTSPPKVVELELSNSIAHKKSGTTTAKRRNSLSI
jgi:hypothetical protein